MVAATFVSICPGGVGVEIGVAVANWQEGRAIAKIDTKISVLVFISFLCSLWGGLLLPK